MVNVMNRAARQAVKADTASIDISIYLVPMHLVEAYYRSEIAREEGWNDAPPVIVVRPVKKLCRADDAWLETTLAQMRQVRRHGTHRFVFPDEHGRGELDIDLGLVDVRIAFASYAGSFAGSPMTDENLRLFDKVCGNALHTQMVIATGVHYFEPDGSHCLHYHNLIFSLRKQIEPDEHIGVIDLLPLVKAVGNGRSLKIVEDVLP